MKDPNIEKFDQMLSALGFEIQWANVYFKQYRDVTSTLRDYAPEMRESPCFWGLASEGLKEGSLIRLCRVFDDDKKSVNLTSVLEVVRSNLEYFSEEVFRDRIGEEKVKEFGVSHRPIDKNQLDKDIDYVDRKRTPLVDKLMIWRGSRFAHKNLKLALTEINGEKIGSPTIEEISELLENGLSMVNRYTGYFRLQSYSPQAIGHDDFKLVLKSVRAHLEERDRVYEEQCREFGFEPY